MPRLLRAIVPVAALVPVTSTMLAVALPAILDDLALDTTAIWWLVTGYLLLVAALQVPSGRLGDRLGPRRMLLGGTGLLASAAAAAAWAPGPTMLVIARLTQGAAGAALVPSALAVLRRTVPEDERDRAVGIFTATLAGGAVVGVAAGGLLVTVGGWRTAFGAVTVAAIAALLVVSRSTRLLGHDETSVVDTGDHRDQAATPRAWIVPASRIALVSLAFHVVLIVVPLRLSAAGFPSATSGLLVGLFALGSGGGALVTPRLDAHLGARRTVEVLMTTSAVALATLVVVPTVTIWLVLCLALAGLGFGSLLGGGFARGLDRTTTDRAGSSSGGLSLARYVGSIAGTASLPPLLDTAGTTGALLLAVGATLAIITVRPRR